jgi:hypothetical protein
MKRMDSLPISIDFAAYKLEVLEATIDSALKKF